MSLSGQFPNVYTKCLPEHWSKRSCCRFLKKKKNQSVFSPGSDSWHPPRFSISLRLEAMVPRPLIFHLVCGACAQSSPARAFSSLEFTPCAIRVTLLSLRIMFLAGEESGNWMAVRLLCYRLTGSCLSNRLILPFMLLPQAVRVFSKLFLGPSTFSIPWLIFWFLNSVTFLEGW